MKRYNRIAKSLIPDIIPALEKAHEKWIKGAEQREGIWIDWWDGSGLNYCGLCDFLRVSGELNCYYKPRCPLRDFIFFDSCCYEWCQMRNARNHYNYIEFHKNAILLRDRIGKLLERARRMAA